MSERAQAVVELSGVRHRYGRTLALDGIGLCIEKGRMVGLIRTGSASRR
jgi:ABC-type multidrug transport system ATPase subunit